MNDVLARLVARSRGSAPFVRPRVPSVFEAAPAGPDPDTAEPVERVVEPPRATFASDVPSPPVPRAADPPAAAAAPTEPASRAAPEPSSEMRITEVRRVDERTHAHTETHTVREAARAVPAPPVAPPDVTRVALPPPAVPIPPVPTASTERTVRVIEPVREAVRPAAPAPPPRMPAPVERVRIEAGDVRTSPPAAATPVSPERGSGLAAEPAEPPVIRVSIGRIDVRAVQEPAKERKRERRDASRRMDLEEYMKRRRGER